MVPYAHASFTAHTPLAPHQTNLHTGIAKYFRNESEEERKHGLLMLDYVTERGGKVTLDTLPSLTPAEKWTGDICANTRAIFDEVLQSEKRTSENINNIVEQALQEKDFATVAFYQVSCSLVLLCFSCPFLSS